MKVRTFARFPGGSASVARPPPFALSALEAVPIAVRHFSIRAAAGACSSVAAIFLTLTSCSKSNAAIMIVFGYNVLSCISLVFKRFALRFMVMIRLGPIMPMSLTGHNTLSTMPDKSDRGLTSLPIFAVHSADMLVGNESRRGTSIMTDDG